jgi:hypothetical protein
VVRVGKAELPAGGGREIQGGCAFGETLNVKTLQIFSSQYLSEISFKTILLGR